MKRELLNFEPMSPGLGARLGVPDHGHVLPAGHSHCTGGLSRAALGVWTHLVPTGRADVQFGEGH